MNRDGTAPIGSDTIPRARLNARLLTSFQASFSEPEESSFSSHKLKTQFHLPAIETGKVIENTQSKQESGEVTAHFPDSVRQLFSDWRSITKRYRTSPLIIRS